MNYSYSKHSQKHVMKNHHYYMQKCANTRIIGSLKRASKDYCLKSSISGFKHLVDKKTSKIEKLIWILVMFGALVCSVSLVQMTFRKFYDAPLVTTKMPQGLPVKGLIFPATSLCTTNRISKRAATELARTLINERNSRYNESEMLYLLKGLGHLYNNDPVDESIYKEVMILHHVLGKYEVSELLKKLTPSCEDLLMRCEWNTLFVNCSNLFNFRLTMNGYCCTFNFLRRSDSFDKINVKRNRTQERRAGQDVYRSGFDFDQGLKILIRDDTSDVFYRNINIEGTKLQFSNAFDFPTAPSGRFAVQYISHTVKMTVLVSARVTVASRDIKYTDKSQRGCLFHDESTFLPFYTYSDCLTKCRALFFLKKCSCTPFNLPKLQNSRTCDLRDLQCLHVNHAQSLAYRPAVGGISQELELDLGGISCPQCCPTCTKSSFSYEFNNVKINPDNLNDVHDQNREDWLRGVNFTGTSIVHVKYGNEFAEYYEQNVIMKWFDLFSNIGSTCGFVTGSSFISVFELLYFITVKLLRDFRSQGKIKHKKQPKQQKKIRKTVKIMERVSESSNAYQSLYWNEFDGGSGII